MKFEEMQKVWDSQRQETFYAIDETALYRRIKAKAAKAARLVNINEIGLTIISLVTGVILITDAISDQESWWDYGTGGLFFLVAAFLIIRRQRRLRALPRFDRTLLGELEHALSGAEELIRVNRGFVWFLLPIAVVTLTGMVWRAAPVWGILLTAGLFVLSWWLVRWELRCRLLPRRTELLSLKDLLTEEETTV